MPAHPRRSLLLFGAAVVALTGCFTGQRPTLETDSPVDDPAAATVLERLNKANTVDFIARYRIVPSRTGEATRATVAQLGDQRRITIGDVDYFTDRVESRTCVDDGADCADFLDDAKISDLNITNGFWGPAFRTRLELDAGRRIGPSSTRSTEIAGQPAVCVDVVVPSAVTTTGTVVYCALDAGVLARYFGADVSIEMTAFSFEVFPSDLEG